MKGLLVQLTLPRRLSSVPKARHWVSKTYALLIERGCCTASAEGTVLELLTSEAVANAVLHGAGEVVVDLSCAEDAVRVSISDDGVDHPVVRRDGPQTIGGHGMALIDTLSSRWGISVPAATGVGEVGVGKTVWFEVTA